MKKSVLMILAVVIAVSFLLVVAGPARANVAGKTYFATVSTSFGTTFTDCFVFTGSTLDILGCFDPATGPMIEVTLTGTLKWWLAIEPCQGLNLIFLGTSLDGSLIGAADVMGGSGVGQLENTTFAVEGIRDPGCTVFQEGDNPWGL